MELHWQNTTTPTAANTDSLDDDLHFSATHKILQALAMSALMIIALVGNLLVVLAFWFFRYLRTVTNCFILALAVSDVLVALIPLPVWMLFILSDGTWWARDARQHTILKTWIFMDITCGISSIMLLACISIDRYLSVAHAIFYQRNASKKKALAAVLVLWSAVILLAAMRLEFPSAPSPSFEFTYAFGCFLFPLIVIISMYFMLFVFARKHVKAASSCAARGQNTRFRKEARIAKVMAVVVFVFFVCWFPFFQFHFFALCKQCKRVAHNPIVVTVIKWLHYSNSAMNPIIYAGMSKEFRNCFKVILSRLCPCLVSSRPTIQQHMIEQDGHNTNTIRTNESETGV